MGVNVTLNVLGYSLNALEVGYRSVHSDRLNNYFNRLKGFKKPPTETEDVEAFPELSGKVIPTNNEE